MEAFYLPRLDLLDPREEPDNHYSAFAQNLAQADLQLVRDGTGHGIYTLSSKQIRSVGAPTWEDAMARLMRMRERGAATLPVYIYTLTTDQGSDEAKYRRIAQAATKDVNEVLVISIDCLFHIGQLIAKWGVNEHRSAVG